MKKEKQNETHEAYNKKLHDVNKKIINEFIYK